MKRSFLEATARQRIECLLDKGSFIEYMPPHESVPSPHLKTLNLPRSFDDGIVVGSGKLNRQTVLIAAQEGQFMGGAVGEVHGAKLLGLLQRVPNPSDSSSKIPTAVLLLLDSGGVRLHEANAGLIAISRIIKELVRVRSRGVPVLALIGGRTGCFGGMGIVARCCDKVIMSEVARLGLSGPEVIETAQGVEEFDSRNKALVWQTVGGKHRYLLGETDYLVEDDIDAFRETVGNLLAPTLKPIFSLESLLEEQSKLKKRLEDFGEMSDSHQIWEAMGIADVKKLAILESSDFLRLMGDSR